VAKLCYVILLLANSVWCPSHKSYYKIHNTQLQIPISQIIIQLYRIHNFKPPSHKS
jgi:hypothetical protein